MAASFWSILIYSAVLITWFLASIFYWFYCARWSSDFSRLTPHHPGPWLFLHYRTWNRTAWSSQGICCWMSWGRPLFAPWIPMDPLGSELLCVGMGCLMVTGEVWCTHMCHEHLTNAFAKCEGSCFFNTCLVGTKWTNDRLVANFPNK